MSGLSSTAPSLSLLNISRATGREGCGSAGITHSARAPARSRPSPTGRRTDPPGTARGRAESTRVGPARRSVASDGRPAGKRRNAGLSVELICVVASVLGLDAAVGLYPNGTPVRDAAQLALLERLRVRLGPDRRLRLEVPMPIVGDRRSVDALQREATFEAMFEAETRVDDVQALIRRIRSKQRDLGCTRVVLLLSDSDITAS